MSDRIYAERKAISTLMLMRKLKEIKLSLNISHIDSEINKEFHLFFKNTKEECTLAYKQFPVLLKYEALSIGQKRVIQNKNSKFCDFFTYSRGYLIREVEEERFNALGSTRKNHSEEEYNNKILKYCSKILEELFSIDDDFIFIRYTDSDNMPSLELISFSLTPLMFIKIINELEDQDGVIITHSK